MTKSAVLQIQTAFKGLDSSDAVKEYAEKRIQKLSKHIQKMAHCHFVFTIEKTDHVAQLHVNGGEFEARAEARAESMYAAIDEVTDKIIHQSRKFKEKRSGE
jgi:putative sigma-54 modulation protein